VISCSFPYFGFVQSVGMKPIVPSWMARLAEFEEPGKIMAAVQAGAKIRLAPNAK
jgi:hypothetical protein